MIDFFGREPYPISKQMRALDSFRSLASDSRASRKRNVSSVNKDKRGETITFFFSFLFLRGGSRYTPAGSYTTLKSSSVKCERSGVGIIDEMILSAQKTADSETTFFQLICDLSEDALRYSSH